MTTPEPPMSPRGVPQLRTDWLADVARRLAVLGLPALRALAKGARGHLTDVVDGQEWTFELIAFSAAHDTVVEFDAELWAPSDDRTKPTLRAGFALAPRWDDTLGAVALVRTEIGPRGAVTFDPENWMVTVPLGGPAAAERGPQGVEPGEWSFDGGLPVLAATADGDALLASLPRMRLELAALAPIIAGEPVPELVVGAFEVAATSKTFLGRLRGPRGPETPVAIIAITADGPLEAAWTGTGGVDQIMKHGLVLGDALPVLAGQHVTVRGPDGVLTLGGRNLQVTGS